MARVIGVPVVRCTESLRLTRADGEGPEIGRHFTRSQVEMFSAEGHAIANPVGSCTVALMGLSAGLQRDGGTVRVP